MTARTTDPHAPRDGAAPVDDALLHALADGRLPAAQAERLRAGLDAPQQEALAQWEHQRARLRALHADTPLPPPPHDLHGLAVQLQALRDRQAQWARWGRWSGMAAGWVVAFGLGWLVHSGWDGAGPLGSAGGAATAQAVQQFAAQAAVAHAVYQPEQRHPVEVAAAQQDHLVQWLSKRLGRPLTVPLLQPQGFDLVGGRLLPGGTGARAQFMYQNAAGTRATLYLGAVDPSQPAPQDTAFRWQAEGGVTSFYWVDEGFGYAMSGAMPRAELATLAQAVYAQLQTK